jgi:hypothetical protein
MMPGELKGVDKPFIFENGIVEAGSARLKLVHGVTDFPPQAFLSEEPAATMLVPFETTTEPATNTLHTLREIEDACTGMGPVEVVVWGNTRLPSPGGEAKDMDAEEKTKISYLGFLGTARTIREADVNPDRLRIRMAHDLTPPAKNPGGHMITVRRRAMEAIMHQAALRHFSAGHPVIWYDADTTYIDPGQPQGIIELLHTEAYLAKGATVFGDKLDTRHLRNLEEAERVAAAYGIGRMLVEQCLAPHDPRTYHEESGLGMTLATASNVITGLVNTQGNIGESKLLLSEVQKLEASKQSILYYDANVKHGTSYRRIVDLARKYMAWEIPDMEDGPAYETYTGLHARGVLARTYIQQERRQGWRERTTNVTDAEILRMFRRMIARQADVCGTNKVGEATKRQLDELTHMFPPYESAYSTWWYNRVHELLEGAESAVQAWPGEAV